MPSFGNKASAFAIKLKTLQEHAKQYTQPPQQLLDDIKATTISWNEVKASYKATRMPEYKLAKQQGRVEDLERRLGQADEDVRHLQNLVQERKNRGESIYHGMQDARKASNNPARYVLDTFTSISDNTNILTDEG